MCITIHEADKIEITTLQDNYIELSAGDNTDIIQRARPLKGLEMKNSILAEHGFSSLVTITSGKMSRTILFDFGFSEHGAAYNADVLDIDLTSVEVMALSHGHLDHVGGLEQLSRRVKKKNVELVLHPSAFKTPRYVKVSEELKIFFPPFTREKALA
ncbi:MAG: MBL fold metallo-hydrolase, partial [Thermodesulfobacteriota bacterium]|nr:MBL fold metallo-hydrolase [Thermodesulfobacteriota bacterium]